MINTLVKIILIIFSVIFIVSSFNNSVELRDNIRFEPSNYSYNFDGVSFLKTFYHMRKGKSFYEANYIGIKYDGRQGPFPLFVSGWRMPTVFFFWRLFAQNGEHIWFLFMILSFFALWSSCDVTKLLGGQVLPVISFLFLIPYFYFAATTTQFLLVEWWAVCFFLISASLFSKNKYFTATSFLLIASLIREIYFLLIIFGTILSFFQKKHRLKIYFGLSLFVFLSFYLLHYIQASRALLFYAGIHLKFFGQDFGNGGILFLRQTLAYGTQHLITTKIGIQASLILLFLTSIGGFLRLFYDRSFTSRFLFGSLFLLIFVFFLFGKSDNDYWGVLYVPILFTLFPSIFSILLLKINRMRI